MNNSPNPTVSGEKQLTGVWLLYITAEGSQPFLTENSVGGRVGNKNHTDPLINIH